MRTLWKERNAVGERRKAAPLPDPAGAPLGAAVHDASRRGAELELAARAPPLANELAVADHRPDDRIPYGHREPEFPGSGEEEVNLPARIAIANVLLDPQPAVRDDDRGENREQGEGESAEHDFSITPSSAEMNPWHRPRPGQLVGSRGNNGSHLRIGDCANACRMVLLVVGRKGASQSAIASSRATHGRSFSAARA